MNVRPNLRQRVSRKRARAIGLREVLIAVVLISGSAACLFWSNRSAQFVRFDDVEFKVEVAKDLADRQIGRKVIKKKGAFDDLHNRGTVCRY